MAKFKAYWDKVKAQGDKWTKYDAAMKAATTEYKAWTDAQKATADAKTAHGKGDASAKKALKITWYAAWEAEVKAMDALNAITNAEAAKNVKTAKAAVDLETDPKKLLGELTTLLAAEKTACKAWKDKVARTKATKDAYDTAIKAKKDANVAAIAAQTTAVKVENDAKGYNAAFTTRASKNAALTALEKDMITWISDEKAKA